MLVWGSYIPRPIFYQSLKILGRPIPEFHTSSSNLIQPTRDQQTMNIQPLPISPDVNPPVTIYVQAYTTLLLSSYDENRPI